MDDKKTRVSKKIMSPETLRQCCNIWKLKSDKVVFTNGCFDVLHAGHLALLLSAADHGNRLIIGLNSDASVKRLKGNQRPLFSQENRALSLAIQTFVDAVIIFDEDTPLDLIKTIRPDVLVKGGDYREAEIVGADFVKSYGGEIAIVPLKPGFSTSSFIKKIKET